MGYEVEPVLINTDEIEPVSFVSGGLWENRKAGYHMYDLPFVPRCSILILGYNRLEKTKYCVECVLKYTNDVDFELILLDNGSTDGTYEYFQSVPYEKKQIIRVTKNIGSMLPLRYARESFKGKYLVILPNDIYVTQNWLANLLKCYESDPTIGFVMPVSSNVSNLQQVDLKYNNMEEMQKKAATFNKSDSSKWEERMRLITVCMIFSRPVMDVVGIFDLAYPHDFTEDDFAIRLRRNGYKLILCKDTWICHDHNFREMEDKDPMAFQKSLLEGREVFREKYHGIDAWDDILNFEIDLLSPLDISKLPDGKLNILVCEGRCGTPALEIRNRLRRRQRTDIASYAFITNAKYYLDAQTVADYITCDRMDFIQANYADDFFNIVVLCEPLNTYPSPITLLQRLYNFLKPGGILLIKLRNTDDYRALLRAAGLGNDVDQDMPAVLPVNDVSECLKLFGARNIEIKNQTENVTEVDKNTLLTILRGMKPGANYSDVTRLITKDYIVKAVKG